jgi:hypothetical protein
VRKRGLARLKHLSTGTATAEFYRWLSALMHVADIPDDRASRADALWGTPMVSLHHHLLVLHQLRMPLGTTR